MEDELIIKKIKGLYTVLVHMEYEEFERAEWLLRMYIKTAQGLDSLNEQCKAAFLNLLEHILNRAKEDRQPLLS